MHHVHTLRLWSSQSRYRWLDPDPAKPSAVVAVLLQLQDPRNFSSSVAKERLSNSFAFDSFVRKQAPVGESKKRKKTQVDFSRGGGGGVSFATFELCCVRPCLKAVSVPTFVTEAHCYDVPEVAGGLRGFIHFVPLVVQHRMPNALCRSIPTAVYIWNIFITFECCAFTVHVVQCCMLAFTGFTGSAVCERISMHFFKLPEFNEVRKDIPERISEKPENVVPANEWVSIWEYQRQFCFWKMKRKPGSTKPSQGNLNFCFIFQVDVYRIERFFWENASKKGKEIKYQKSLASLLKQGGDEQFCQICALSS